MRNLMIFFTGGITFVFLLVGCGQAGDVPAQAEESIPEGAEMVSLKVEGMT